MKVMNVLWFSGRHFDDLCATTQKSLAKGLVNKGHQLTFVNPDPNGSHEGYPWMHQGLPIKSLPGLKSLSVGRKMSHWLKQNPPSSDTIAILDWRIANKLAPQLDKFSIPWILMDRSPPADGNILSRLQWYFWKRSWNMVKKRPDGVGCVVSNSHKEFIINKFSIEEKKLIPIPAGVDLELFKVGDKKPSLQLSYHGRVDKNRGLMELIKIHSQLLKEGLDVTLNIHGKGNSRPIIQNYQSEKVNITDSLETDKLAKLSSSYDIGFLPMPNSKVWRLASPLKRSEYLASGMIVLGIDHSGHQIEDSGDWLQLFGEDNFVESSVRVIKNLETTKLRELQKGARLFAESTLDWSKSVDILDGLLSKQS